MSNPVLVGRAVDRSARALSHVRDPPEWARKDVGAIGLRSVQINLHCSIRQIAFPARACALRNLVALPAGE